MGTPGRSWVAMSRPVAGAADSSFAIEAAFGSRGSRRAGAGVAQAVREMGRQWGGLGVEGYFSQQCTFNYLASLSEPNAEAPSPPS
jgi:uncharacterized protein YukE